MKKAGNTWHNYRMPFDPHGELLDEAKPFVDAAYELWTLQDDPSGVTPAYTAAQQRVADVAPSWVLAEVLVRCRVWGPAEVTAFHTFERGYRSLPSLLRIFAAADPEVTPRGAALASRAGHGRHLTSNWAPEQAAFLAVCAGQDLPDPTFVGHLGVSASASLALAVAAQRRPKQTLLRGWLLHCLQLPSDELWRAPACDVEWLVARVLRDLSADDPLRALVLQFVAGKSLALVDALATDRELAQWVAYFQASSDAGGNVQWRFDAALRESRTGRLAAAAVLDLPGIVPLLRSGAFKERGVAVLAKVLNGQLGGCDALAWQLALEWSDSSAVTLRDVCEAARRTADVAAVPAAA
jgi:hypothetical protein